ncbi:MAG: 3-deoxy-7-phosphoheptulonate synthase [Thermovirgaceae bacterium]|nr:3-deoxy-7-phosphoheptulonate synthase [Thermovirgaceae bacterium]
MMIIQMNDHCTSLDVARVCDQQERPGCPVRIVPRSGGSCVVVDGDSDAARQAVSDLPGVKSVSITKCSYPLASREIFGAAHPVELAPGVRIGGGEIVVMAGPCSVETGEILLETARGVKASGASVLRGGAFKPRSNPYSFQGLGSEGIALLMEARQATGLPVITEVMAPEDVEWLAPHVDILQVGTRNMQNFALLKALGRVDKPVLLKRGMMSTVDEWLQAAEYILVGGNERVVLCERGIRSFDKSTRNTLDLSIVPLVKSLTHLPVIVDPSHATGKRELVLPMSLAALAAGADGLIIEVHPRPEEALSDGPQSLDLEAFDELMQAAGRILAALQFQEGKRCGLKIAM